MENKKILDNSESKIHQVRSITIKCPLKDESLNCLKISLHNSLSSFIAGKNMFKNIPCADLLSIFLFTFDFCNKNKIDVSFLKLVFTLIQSFDRLKYVTLLFTYNKGVRDTYEIMINNYLKKENKGISTEIYKIDSIELNLSEQLNQDTIDILNRSFIFNDIISNSYLKRTFVIEFEYDEYVSYINMLVNNDYFNNLYDLKIIDCLINFPPLINEHKPLVKVVTNYDII